ncbi:hypothetical protein ACFVIM_27685 [Streptomyces sp. NPDC057638]|uniref:hypothetical protein n=1 Tax=Streptomyces sp. NPDC057638 TaxID=3346190 RepID=UPI003678BB21
MISYTKRTSTTARSIVMTDRSVVVSACSLGLIAPLAFPVSGTGLPGFGAERPVMTLGGLPVLERAERPTTAREAGVVAQAKAYAFAASGATQKQTKHNKHNTWAFRGLPPWSDPA